MESINSVRKGLHLKDAACYQEAAVYQIRALECETNPKLSIIYLAMTQWLCLWLNPLQALSQGGGRRETEKIPFR